MAETHARKRKGGALTAFVWTLVVLLALGGAAVGGGFYTLTRLAQAPGPAVAETTVNLPRGSGLIAIASRLEQAGAIDNRHVFRAWVTLTGDQTALKAGEYAIPAGASIAQIAELIETGDVVLHTITFAEGLTSAMVVEVLNASDVLVGEIDAVPQEGTLLPETYAVIRGTERAELLARMASDKQELLDDLWANRADNLPFDTVEEAVILASVVEKETGVASERPLVASVFVNRLRRGMRLQSDPTIIYGITQGYPLGRGIRQSELDAQTPYNTYQIDGLPPTPICNPGRDSLAAVLDPPDTNYLFFVADGTGGHAFSETYAEHNRNVQRWRAIERQRRNAQ